MRELGLTLTLTLTLALTLTLTLSLPHQDHLRELGLTTVGDRLYFIDLLTQVRRSRVTSALFMRSTRKPPDTALRPTGLPPQRRACDSRHAASAPLLSASLLPLTLTRTPTLTLNTHPGPDH